MSELPDFRSWAARVGREAAEERDDSRVLRLMSIAGYWERLAHLEDWQRDSLAFPSGLLGSCKPIGAGLNHAAAQTIDGNEI
jgi:hypothetical protein